MLLKPISAINSKDLLNAITPAIFGVPASNLCGKHAYVVLEN